VERQWRGRVARTNPPAMMAHACAKLRRMLPANFMTTATSMPPAALVKMAAQTTPVKPWSGVPSSLMYLSSTKSVPAHAIGIVKMHNCAFLTQIEGLDSTRIFSR
jgi:hypothetical protein